MEQATTTAAFEAFLKAQSEFKTAIKDSVNPHFKSKFADFASVYDAVKDALHNNGFYVTQPIQISDNGFPIVETIVRYKDGTEIERSACPVVAKQQNDPQAMGSAITYARRYSLAAILCVVTDDDDAEAAIGDRNAKPQPQQRQQSASSSNVNFDEWQMAADACRGAADLNRLKKDVAASKFGDDDFKKVWAMLTKRAKALGCNYDKDAKNFT
ncbi:ERF family protein [Spirosoma sp. KUDC1026]|uniref:ERF family protein n=1 Tax=Spirosoma sp. KUDC1026 TaxID=2745947 RepID=UPI00159BA642|nr:ERF family protein [Spirosoma sp. KUDC1026]QKZ15156.1 ERF family protein [Spirosoma sp. KUDC1026]